MKPARVLTDLLKATSRSFCLTLRVRSQKRRRAAALQDVGARSLQFRQARSVLDCASPLALFHRLPVRAHLKFIRHRNPIHLEPVYGLYHCRRSRAFKPGRRAPRILAGHRHQPVFHRVLMNVVQPCQIRALMRQPGFAKVEPNLPARHDIQLVHPLRRFDMQHAQHIAQAGSVVSVGGRMGDEMVVIRKHRPCFQLPAKLVSHDQQAAMQNPQPFRAAKVVCLLIG
jgi:hypothetical protein